MSRVILAKRIFDPIRNISVENDFSNRLLTVKDKKKEPIGTISPSKFKNEPQKYPCTYTYKENEDSTDSNILGPNRDQNYYITPEAILTGSGKLILEVNTDLPKSDKVYYTSGGKIGNELSTKKSTIRNGDVNNSSLIYMFKTKLEDPFDPKKQHFTVAASCSHFDNKGRYLGRQNAKKVALPPPPKLVEYCFIGIWPCAKW